jgi:FtsZ-interacting cell division protein ZipA
MSLLNTNLE